MLLASDRKAIIALEKVWICRVPQEITILIVRVLFEAKKRENWLLNCMLPKSLQKFLQDDRQSLREFLEFLKNSRWESRPAKDEVRPLVPMTFCFDETYEKIEISKPTWPEGKFADRHP